MKNVSRFHQNIFVDPNMHIVEINNSGAAKNYMLRPIPVVHGTDDSLRTLVPELYSISGKILLLL